eukprot:g2755.t1
MTPNTAPRQVWQYGFGVHSDLSGTRIYTQDAANVMVAWGQSVAGGDLDMGHPVLNLQSFDIQRFDAFRGSTCSTFDGFMGEGQMESALVLINTQLGDPLPAGSRTFHATAGPPGMDLRNVVYVPDSTHYIIEHLNGSISTYPVDDAPGFLLAGAGLASKEMLPAERHLVVWNGTWLCKAASLSPLQLNSTTSNCPLHGNVLSALTDDYVKERYVLHAVTGASGTIFKKMSVFCLRLYYFVSREKSSFPSQPVSALSHGSGLVCAIFCLFYGV